MPILHERRHGVDRRCRDHGGYPGFDRRVRVDQRKRRSRLDLLSDAEWTRYLEMPNLLEMPVSMTADQQMHFHDIRRRESR
jgi:hypothetical protein